MLKKLSGSCFYHHLWQLRSVRHSPTTSAANTLVHALISSRTDYCNNLLYGVCEVHIRQLQSVLNSVARLITSKWKFDHIISTIRNDLHWLPVWQCIQFKLWTLVSKCLRCTAPSYLTDMCAPCVGSVWSLVSTAMLAPRPLASVLSTDTVWTARLLRVRTHRLELVADVHPRPVGIIFFLSSPEDWAIR